MKQETKTPNRFYRPRRPGGIGAGLQFEGVTNIFGLLGIGLLVIIGIAMLLVRNSIREKDLEPVSITLQAPPYHIPKLRNSVLLSITGARVMALDQAAFAAADTSKLLALQRGDALKAWMLKKEAEKWNNNIGRKDFYKAMMLQKTDGTWIIDYKGYNRKASNYSGQGWWLILLGCILLPYQIMRQTKIPVWAAILAYLILVAIYLIMQ
jgi:hypothetical protein